MKDAGLTADDGRHQAWALTPDGEVLGGAAAVNAALEKIRWAKPLALLYRLPGLRQLEDVVYRWVAHNRHHFPGITPACEDNPNCTG